MLAESTTIPRLSVREAQAVYNDICAGAQTLLTHTEEMLTYFPGHTREEAIKWFHGEMETARRILKLALALDGQYEPDPRD